MSERIQIEILLFAGAAEKAGQRLLQFEMKAGDTIQGLLESVVRDFSQLDSLAKVSRWAVNGEFVPVDFVLEESIQVAMIPPVSGG